MFAQIFKTMNNQEEIKEWFESNYLDGDKIQDGQMLSSKECLDALYSLLAKKREEIEELRQPNQQVSEYYSGFNKAIDDIIKILT